jgi:hypothetical protein
VTGRTARSDSASIHINATPDTVYDLIADVRRMGEWSPECVRCEWLEPATTAAVGARFKAHNKRTWMRWSNTPTVITADRPREFAFSRRSTGAGEYIWRFHLQPEGNHGTHLTESYEAVRAETWLVSTFARLFTPNTEAQHLKTGMRTTVTRIKQAAELEPG